MIRQKLIARLFALPFTNDLHRPFHRISLPFNNLFQLAQLSDKFIAKVGMIWIGILFNEVCTHIVDRLPNSTNQRLKKGSILTNGRVYRSKVGSACKGGKSYSLGHSESIAEKGL